MYRILPSQSSSSSSAYLTNHVPLSHFPSHKKPSKNKNKNKNMLKLFPQLRRRRRSNHRHDHQNPNPDTLPERADSDVIIHIDDAIQADSASSSGVARGGEEENDNVVEEPTEVSRSGDNDEVDHSEGKGLEVKSSAGKNRMEVPPEDDCCPICFGAFAVPCRGPCGHWYCGGCILQYWNYTAALQPCNCPMCSQKITKLTPEASLSQQQEAEVVEVLRNVRKYNHLFLGGPYGMILKMFELPLYVKRMFTEMMNPDRPGAHLNKLRIFAMTLGFFYSISPFDILGIGRHNVVDVFDYSAILLSLILYGVGIYMRRQRFRNVRELAAIQL